MSVAPNLTPAGRIMLALCSVAAHHRSPAGGGAASAVTAAAQMITALEMGERIAEALRNDSDPSTMEALCDDTSQHVERALEACLLARDACGRDAFGTADRLLVECALGLWQGAQAIPIEPLMRAMVGQPPTRERLEAS